MVNRALNLPAWRRRADTSELVTTQSDSDIANVNRNTEYEAPDWVKHALHQGKEYRDSTDGNSKSHHHSQVLIDRFLSHPGRLSVAYFLGLIYIVTLLLLLPAASRQSGSTSFHIAFFTAVSALSTCGIPVVNTALHWTAFGQVIILLAVQMGGLGIMTFASMITMATSRHLKVSQRILTANELGASKLSEVKSIVRVVFAITFSMEAITFAALFPGLYSYNHGRFWATAWQSLFYAVSAYNNTGFTPDAAGFHINSWGVGLPILISAFIGTIGFPVILNIVRSTRARLSPATWSLHTKLTLLTSGLLVVVSMVWFLANEWNNTALFPASTDASTRLRQALSAAVMPRSAGFDTSWMPQVSEQTKVFISGIMFIGTGSSSAGGGIRVTTFAVLLLICRAAFTRQHDVTVFRRRLPRRVRLIAVSVSVTCMMLVLFAAMALIIITGCSFTDAIFEATSAFSLGGATMGVASVSQPASMYVLALVMIVGRLGPMTIAYAISKPHPASVIRYPEESIVVG